MRPDIVGFHIDEKPPDTGPKTVFAGTTPEIHMPLSLDEITQLLLTKLQDHNVHPDVDLSAENMGAITIGQLALDSLDLLQFAMDVEDELDIESDVAEFPADATLLDLAAHFHELHAGPTHD